MSILIFHGIRHLGNCPETLAMGPAQTENPGETYCHSTSARLS